MRKIIECSLKSCHVLSPPAGLTTVISHYLSEGQGALWCLHIRGRDSATRLSWWVYCSRKVSHSYSKSGRKSILIPTLNYKTDLLICSGTWLISVGNLSLIKRIWNENKELSILYKIYYIYLQTIYYFWQTYNAFADKFFKSMC